MSKKCLKNIDIEYLCYDGGYEGEWKHINVTEFTYDFAYQGDVLDDVLGGKLVSCIYYTVNDDDELEIWNNEQWEGTNKNTYEYNDNGSKTRMGYCEWKDGDRNEYKYIINITQTIHQA